MTPTLGTATRETAFSSWWRASSSRCKTMRSLVGALVLLSAAAVGRGQGLDTAFDAMVAPNVSGTSYIYATAVQPDGKILIGGAFTSILGTARNNIARLNANGTLDATFNPGADGDVYCITVQPDGKILAGGFFNNIGGQARPFIARLNATTGAADTAFDANATGTNVFSIAVQTDGNIVVGGVFTAMGGQPRINLARLGATGTADSFNPAPSATVRALAIQRDGKILVGGLFTTIAGQTRNRIARFDSTGTLDTFDPNVSNSVVRTFAIQADGKILVGGQFTGTIGGQPRTRIARLDPLTGAPDSFNPVANQNVYSIVVQADGKILVGGFFTNIGGAARNHIARLDSSGVADSFDPNADDGVNGIVLLTNGQLMVGGNYLTIGGGSRSFLARLNNDTAATQSLAATTSSTTWTRGGSSVQFNRVTFESSPDNVTYTALGAGIPSGSDWTLSGLSLPTAATFYIRGRGYYRTGYQGGSEASLELVQSFTPPSANLGITKTDGVTTATPGGSTTYTITASNAGPSNTTGTVADTFPASLTCTWTCAGAGGGICSASGSGNINNAVTLPNGASVTYTATCSISAAATGSLSNTATVTGALTDPIPGNNSATDTDTLAPSANLGITKTDGVVSATPGGSTTYTITASNAGPSNTTGTVADTFPASLTCTWTCVGAGGGTCTASGSGNINNSVTLPSGGSVTHTASCAISAAATGSLSNTATVSGAATDPVPGNNSATDTDTLAPSANLGITKTDGVTTVTAGGNTTYTIVASNAGPSNTTGTVADTFPAALTCTWTCVGAGGGTCTASGSGNINDSVTLPSGGSVTYTASCSISGAATGSLSNTATVTGVATDPTPGNNSATDTDTITSPLEPAPSVTGAVTTMNTQTASGLVITTASGTTTHFKITAITNGTLFQFNGTTPIFNNDFITLAQGNAGLKFTPSVGFTGNAGFAVAADNGSPGTKLGPTTTANVLVGSTVAAGDLVIREFRSRGPAGALDEYIEIANRSAGPLTVASTDLGSTGFGIAHQPAVLLATIPNGTVIPAGGFYLAANSTGYSLSGYGGASAAAPDSPWTTDLPESTGIGLFKTNTTFTAGTVLDAVGFVGSASPYLEGAGIPVPSTTGTSDVAYLRESPGGVIQDTGDNASDFYLGDTNAGTFGPVTARLAAPGPQKVASEKAKGLTFTLLDPAKSPTTFPNRYRVTITPTTGIYYFRWKVQNDTGAAITKLRVRVSNVATLNSPGYVLAGTQADFRLITTLDAPITTPAVTALASTVQVPGASLPLDGGYNASAEVLLPGGTLGIGQSVYINVGFKYQQAGSYGYFVSGEAK